MPLPEEDFYIWPAAACIYSAACIPLLWIFKPFKYFPLSMGIHAINLGVYSYALRNQYKYDFFCGKQLLLFFFWFYFDT
jgi:hypothetical protein